MGFLNKLFGNKKEDNGNKANPAFIDNSRLIRLLDAWSRNESAYTYTAVIKELFDGNSSLLIPITSEEGEELQSTLISEKEEEKTTLSVFSDEENLIQCAKDVNALFTTLTSQELLSYCEEHEIERLVINPGCKNMFVFDLVRDEPEEELPEVGYPASPLSRIVTDRLAIRFSEIGTIEEAYQFTRKEEDETILMIGVRTTADADEIRPLIIEAIKNALQGEKVKMPMGVMLLDDDWLGALINSRIPVFYRQETEEMAAEE